MNDALRRCLSIVRSLSRRPWRHPLPPLVEHKYLKTVRLFFDNSSLHFSNPLSYTCSSRNTSPSTITQNSLSNTCSFLESSNPKHSSQLITPSHTRIHHSSASIYILITNRFLTRVNCHQLVTIIRTCTMPHSSNSQFLERNGLDSEPWTR